jgi:hypothetical protein
MGKTDETLRFRKVLRVKRGTDRPAFSDLNSRTGPPDLVIDRYFWMANGYTPRVEVRLFHTDRYLTIDFKAYEREIRAVCRHFQDPVYEDSCVEFFLDPFPEKDIGYVNIETNPLGTMLIGLGRDRTDRRLLDPEEAAGIDVAASVTQPIEGGYGADFWRVTYRIPAAFFKRLYGERLRAGLQGRGNFYKCGDAAAFAHYGAWSPIESPVPDFHLPRFFGLLVFE